MSETVEQTAQASNSNGVKLDGFYAFKLGMSTVYNDKGESVPVTVLKYEPWYVTQVKTKEKDGYEAVQLSCGAKKSKNSNSAEKGHFKNSPFENGAHFVKELRVKLPEGLAAGQVVALDSLAKGDTVKLTSRSKGKGFQGVVKRFGHHGGPAAHGSTFHRRPGSMGCRTWPGRVKPGRKLPGHTGDRNVTLKNVEIVDIVPNENVLLVRGPVPGAYNSLVKIVKE